MVGHRVSIVIPCFNAGSTIKETIESALAQTWRNLEIVVVNDGSIDGSGGVIKNFGDAIVAHHGPNRGASAARNLGTSLSCGNYIQYLDADDILTPDAVERRVAVMEDWGADIAYSDWQRFEMDKNGTRQLGQIVARDMEEIHRDAQIACATSFWAPPVALLYRRRIVNAIGGWNERLPIIQDARLLFDAARLGARFARVERVTGYYRESPASLSRRDARRFFIEIFNNAVEIRALWEADGPLDHEREAALAAIFDSAARNLFSLACSEFENAVQHLNTLTGRRFGYPEMAYYLRRLFGQRAAYNVMRGISHISRQRSSLKFPSGSQV
jgi:glycosyltransferase involved in cell wall biosynthesis